MARGRPKKKEEDTSYTLEDKGIKAARVKAAKAARLKTARLRAERKGRG